MPKMRYLAPVFIFLVLAVLLWRGLNLDPHHVPSALIDKPVPVFSLSSLDNGTLNQQDLQGKVTLVNVWATWCVSCREDHQRLLAIAKENIVPIYGIDYKDHWNSAKNWLDLYGNPYAKVGFDEDGRAAINWGVYGTPETFVIDKHGIIRYKHTGPLTQTVWEHILKPLVKKLQEQG